MLHSYWIPQLWVPLQKCMDAILIFENLGIEWFYLFFNVYICSLLFYFFEGTTYLIIPKKFSLYGASHCSLGQVRTVEEQVRAAAEHKLGVANQSITAGFFDNNTRFADLTVCLLLSTTSKFLPDDLILCVRCALWFHVICVSLVLHCSAEDRREYLEGLLRECKKEEAAPVLDDDALNYLLARRWQSSFFILVSGYLPLLWYDAVLTSKFLDFRP